MFEVGNKINYGFYSGLEVIAVDDEYYHLRDKSGNIKCIYRSLVDKYGKLVSYS